VPWTTWLLLDRFSAGDCANAWAVANADDCTNKLIKSGVDADAGPDAAATIKLPTAVAINRADRVFRNPVLARMPVAC
jgi:hypothetical protein